MMEALTAQPATLQERWNGYKQKNPKSRIRDAARALGVQEVELLALGCGNGVTRLAGDWKELLLSFVELGPIMALTRNEHAVHEKKGIYQNLSFEGAMGMALDKNIDLRFFMRHWAKAFACEDETLRGKRYNFQFFDRYGQALHKVYLEENSNVDAFIQLVAKWRSPDQSKEEPVEALPPQEQERPDTEVDVQALRQSWEGMTNTHEFVGLLRDHNVSRRQALRLIGNDMAWQVDRETAHRFILQRASETHTPIMIFVGSPGCVQIHTGEVHRLLATEAWYNILDPGFNLHLREQGIAQSWVVRKPTSDGIVTSLELYDDKGETIAIFFGSRKETVSENPDWREIVAALPPAQAGTGNGKVETAAN